MVQLLSFDCTEQDQIVDIIATAENFADDDSNN